MESIFFEITLVICLTAFLAICFRLLKQPAILAYILAGIIIGPFGKLQLHNPEVLQTMGEFGVALLLFILGLEFKFRELKSVGKQVIFIGSLQIIFTSFFGFIITLLLGFPFSIALFLGLALTFSSTIVIVSILADRKEVASLHGRITVGILLVQDIAAILILVILPQLGSISSFSYGIILFQVLFKAVCLVGGIFLLSRTILPRLLHSIAGSLDTLFLFSLAWVLAVSAITSSPFIGFPIAIGGFLAGIALANTSESIQIGAKIRTLRDFFLVIFFVTLGMQMTFDFRSIGFLPVVVLSLFVVLLKPLIVVVLTAMFGYRKRTAFLTGVSMGQISEFSLIVIFLGNRLGYIPNEISSLVALVSIISFIVSAYIITHGRILYPYMHTYLSFIERNVTLDSKKPVALREHTVLIGARGIGESILQALRDSKEELIVIDFNPDVIALLKEKGIAHVFGDIADFEIQETANVHSAKLIISTVPEKESNMLLIAGFRRKKGQGILIAVAENRFDAKILYKEGADYVVLPDVLGGLHIAHLIRDSVSEVKERIEKLKERDKTLFFL